ncbi:MAG: hypothetical protein AAGI71_00460 [Bacteroidota bacterium]
MPKTPSRKALLSVLPLLLVSAPAWTQTAPEVTPPSGPFSTVGVFVGSGPTGRAYGTLPLFWQPQRHAEAVVLTPFYAGYAELGGAYRTYDPLPQTSVPAFSSLQVFAGWGGVVPLGPRLRFHLGGRIGTHRMSFDADEDFEGLVNESELIAGLQARLHVRIAGPLVLFGAVTYQQTFTEVPMRTLYGLGGLGLQRRTPGWLLEVLR